MEHIFTQVYETNEWGNNNVADYNGSSGAGSSVDFNQKSYVPFLKKFITDKGIQDCIYR